MRRLLTFIVLIAIVLTVMDKTHTPPNIVHADTQRSNPRSGLEITKPVETSPPASNINISAKFTVAGGCEQYRSLISEHEWSVQIMMAVMQAESHQSGLQCNSDATGDRTLTFAQNGRTYGYSVSLFQVRILPGREACDTHDPAKNVECAYGIWKRQGYGAWSTYNDGKYRRFLK